MYSSTNQKKYSLPRVFFWTQFFCDSYYYTSFVLILYLVSFLFLEKHKKRTYTTFRREERGYVFWVVSTSLSMLKKCFIRRPARSSWERLSEPKGLSVWLVLVEDFCQDWRGDRNVYIHHRSISHVRGLVQMRLEPKKIRDKEKWSQGLDYFLSSRVSKIYFQIFSYPSLWL